MVHTIRRSSRDIDDNSARDDGRFGAGRYGQGLVLYVIPGNQVSATQEVLTAEIV